MAGRPGAARARARAGRAAAAGPASSCGCPTCARCSAERLGGPADPGQLPHRHADRLHDGADALGAAPRGLPARPRRRRLPAGRRPSTATTCWPAGRSPASATLRSEDRQLLLDAMMAATETLVVTYTGANETTGQPGRPPSRSASCSTPSTTPPPAARAHASASEHPLQAFDARNLPSRPGTPSPSTGPRWRGAAAAAARPGPRPAWSRSTAAAAGPADVELAALVTFFLHPVRGVPARPARRRPARRGGGGRRRAAGRARQPRAVGGRRPDVARPAPGPHPDSGMRSCACTGSVRSCCRGCGRGAGRAAAGRPRPTAGGCRARPAVRRRPPRPRRAGRRRAGRAGTPAPGAGRTSPARRARGRPVAAAAGRGRQRGRPRPGRRRRRGLPRARHGRRRTARGGWRLRASKDWSGCSTSAWARPSAAVSSSASSSSPSGTAGGARLAGGLVGAAVGDHQLFAGGHDRVEQELAVLAAQVALAGERGAGEHVVAVDGRGAREHAVVETEQAHDAVRHRAHRHHGADGERAGAEVGPGRLARRAVRPSVRGRRGAAARGCRRGAPRRRRVP